MAYVFLHEVAKQKIFLYSTDKLTFNNSLPILCLFSPTAAF